MTKRQELWVTLTPAHAKLCKAYADICHDYWVKKGNTDARVVDKRSGTSNIELVGTMGEMALCMATGWQPNWSFTPTDDQGIDFVVNGITIQVKTGMNQMAKNLMFKDYEDFRKDVDVAVFVQYAGHYQYDPIKDPQFVICGYVPRVEFMKRCDMRDFGRGVGPQPCMHMDKLLNIWDLIALVKQKGEL